MNFRDFLLENDQSDIKQTLNKLPVRYQNLVKSYKFKFQAGNTLKGDGKHIGCIDEKTKTITLAGPFFYSREFVVLHELSHLVWNKLLNKEQKSKWIEISKNTKHKSESDPEENFCHAFARHYAKDKPGEDHDHEKWDKFIKNLTT